MSATVERAGPASLEAERVLRDLDTVGYAVARGLVAADRLRAIRAAMRAILVEEKPLNLRPNRHQRILHLAMKEALFIELVTHPFVLEIWRRRLGEDVLCSSLTGNSLWPGCTEQYWHVDHPYWTMTQPYPTSLPLCGQTIWMIDDFTGPNGATAVIPGSHRTTHLPELGSAWTDDAVVLTGQCGDAIFMDGALWHTSRPNKTKSIRHAVLAKYIRSFCVTQEDMRMQLAAIDDPTEELQALFGAKQYLPRKGFPY